jgi:dTDP-D-glucose 4,6-dehydratase
MKIGDLVRYNDSPDIAVDRKKLSPELGIITKTDPGMPLRCHVEWFTCDNRGWWTYKNLEKVNENR